jgi:hypothetical protein
VRARATPTQQLSASRVLTSPLRGKRDPAGQGELAVLAPRQCAWPPCSRWFTPKPGGTNAHYCDRDCKRLAKAQRLRERRDVDLADDSMRPRHPFLVAVEAAEAELARGAPLAGVLADLRVRSGVRFADVVAQRATRGAGARASAPSADL